jgi:hypothetical protein
MLFSRQRIHFAGAAGGNDCTHGMGQQRFEIVPEAWMVQRQIIFEWRDWKGDHTSEFAAEFQWIHFNVTELW